MGAALGLALGAKAQQDAALPFWASPTLTIIVGQYYLKANGNLASAGGFQAVNLPIVAGDLAIRVTGSISGTSTALVTWVDAAGGVISPAYEGTGSTVTYTEQILSPPANASAALITTLSAFPFRVEVMRTRAAPLLQLDGWVTPASIAQANQYLTTAGLPFSAAGYQYRIFALDGTETAVVASGFTNGASTQLATFYDAAGVKLGIQFAGTGSSVRFVNQTLSVPPRTASIGITSSSASLPPTLSVKRAVAPIAVFGDSTAALLAPVLATQYPARHVFNQGIGGQTTAQIAARMGVNPVTLPAFTMPTSGSVAVTPSVDLLFSNRSTAWSIRATVLGIPGVLTAAASTGAYTFTPTSYPGGALSIPAGTPIVPVSGVSASADPSGQPSLDRLLAGTVAVRAGRNDTAALVNNGAPAILALMGGITTAVAARGGRLAMLTSTNGNFDMPVSSGLSGASAADEAAADARLAAIANLNNQMRATWPDRVFDVQAWHVVNGGSTARTVNGNTYAVLDNPTMNTDGLHESSGVGLPRAAAFIRTICDAVGR